jgi:hypothetical protein
VTRLQTQPAHWVARCHGMVGPRSCLMELGHDGNCSLKPSGKHYVLGHDWLLPVAYVEAQQAKFARRGR